MGKELSVIIPTFNEKENIHPLLKKLDAVLKGIEWEVIFVDDDSPDGTAALVRKIARERQNVRCLQRIGRRGLSSACVEGFLASAAPIMGVMDADMQHDEKLLPEMYNTISAEDLDVVIGSRYVEGGGVGEWSRSRETISRMATRISQRIIKADLKDPMSGFFMVERSFFEKVVRRLSNRGFKILLDLFASSPEPVRFKELPYQFRNRQAGESKLGAFVSWEFFMLIVDKMIGWLIPVRFILFAMVGLGGAVIHLTSLGLFYQWLSLPFYLSQSFATLMAMTFNFFLDNLLTYRDKKLSGMSWIKGLLSFYAACSIGAVINLRISVFLFDYSIPWWLAGFLGAVVGSVWNYAITATFTWKNRG
jgi:dolichol-phosphate mannosyltransferase